MLDLELLRANRTFRLVFPFAVLLAFVALSRNVAFRGPAARRVSLAELEKATEHVPFLTLYGRDGRHFRFHAPDGRVFLVDHKEVQPLLDAAAFSAREGVGLFVTIKGGAITIADPSVVSEWARRRGVDGPLPAREPALPVARHTTQSEPTLLVLTSDGDWDDDDLARLDRVLNDWLSAERPGVEDDDALPEAERPRLWYDAANSARDFKTIIVRARNFRDAWCEPLARRLAAEFPFLWRMDVGDRPGPVIRGVGPSPPGGTPSDFVD
jgi:hypothetical protein